MSKKNKEVVGQVEQQEVQGEEEVKVAAELTIKLFDNGGIEVGTPEGAEELSPLQIEGITRNISEQLRDARVAQQAVEMFKSRLG